MGLLCTRDRGVQHTGVGQHFYHLRTLLVRMLVLQLHRNHNKDGAHIMRDLRGFVCALGVLLCRCHLRSQLSWAVAAATGPAPVQACDLTAVFLNLTRRIIDSNAMILA